MNALPQSLIDLTAAAAAALSLGDVGHEQLLKLALAIYRQGYADGTLRTCDALSGPINSITREMFL
jgi:hypothetical protein